MTLNIKNIFVTSKLNNIDKEHPQCKNPKSFLCEKFLLEVNTSRRVGHLFDANKREQRHIYIMYGGKMSGSRRHIS